MPNRPIQKVTAKDDGTKIVINILYNYCILLAQKKTKENPSIQKLKLLVKTVERQRHKQQFCKKKKIGELGEAPLGIIHHSVTTVRKKSDY